MSEVKMSDVFELPVKKMPGGMMPYLKDCNGIVIFVGDDSHIRAAVIAINNYDANQERIAELEKESAHWKSNHDNVVNKLRVFTRRPDLTINKQQEEIKTLKAQVNHLRDTIADCRDNIYAPFDDEALGEWSMQLLSTLNKTPQQCLADVRASVITSTIGDIEVGMANAPLDGDDILEYLNIELDKLRK